MDDFLLDLRFALRSLRRTPVVTLAAILSLALGIGATASIFSAVDVFMIRPLPYPDSEDLVRLYMGNRDRGWSQSSVSMLDFLDYREESTTLEVGAYYYEGVNLSDGDRPERLEGIRTSQNLMEIFRLQPVVGRGFRPEEEVAGSGTVVMISYALWEDRFGSDPGVIGRTVNLDGVPHDVIGVLPPRFVFTETTPDLWRPFQLTGEENRSSHYLRVLARLTGGATLATARSEMDQMARQHELAYPGTNAGKTVELYDLKSDIFDEGFEQGSLISSAAVLFVLLIACANVANLLLARGAGRSREMAVRGALGAGRARLMRQLLTESLFMACAGGLAGVVVAFFGIRWLVAMMPAFFPQRDLVSLDPRVLGFMAGITILSGLIFGLAPALQASRMNLRSHLSDGGRGGSEGRGSGRLRRWLVTAEITLAVVLLVSASVMIRSYASTRDVDLGYEVENILTARLTLPETKYPDQDAINAFWREALERTEALPGVQVAGGTNHIPTQGMNSTYYSIPTEEPPPEGQRPTVAFKLVTPEYFEVMKISLLQGRGFTTDDREGQPEVAIINESMARRHWEGRNPLGERIQFTNTQPEIVGVVEDTREWGPDSDPFAMVYTPVLAGTTRSLGLVLETAGDPYLVVEDVRAEILAMDPDQPVYQAFSMADVLQEEMGGNLIMVRILTVLGIIAFVLAVVGVYGVMAYSVTRRTQEMGIRMALGADRRNVLALIVKQGGIISGIGVGIGLVISLGATRGLAFFLFGADPFDPVSFGMVAAALMAAGLTASYFPALRATRVDPMVAFRGE
jgi:putative ABC transport system permease protein